MFIYIVLYNPPPTLVILLDFLLAANLFTFCTVYMYYRRVQTIILVRGMNIVEINLIQLPPRSGLLNGHIRIRLMSDTIRSISNRMRLFSFRIRYSQTGSGILKPDPVNFRTDEDNLTQDPVNVRIGPVNVRLGPVNLIPDSVNRDRGGGWNPPTPTFFCPLLKKSSYI